MRFEREEGFYLKDAASAILSKKNSHTFNPIDFSLDKDN